MKRTYAFRKPWKRSAARLFDMAGGIVCAPFVRRRPAHRPQRILVVRLDHLGDVITALPLIQGLADVRPKPFLGVLVSGAGAELLRDVPGIDARIVFDAPWTRRAYTTTKSAPAASIVARLRAERFDAAFEPKGDLRHLLLLTRARIPFRAGYANTGGGFLLHQELPWDPARHAADENAALLACAGLPVPPAATPRLTWTPRSGELQWLEQAVPAPRFAVLHVDAGTAAKRWAPERFAPLARFAASQGLHPVIAGADRTLSPVLKHALAGTAHTDLLGKTSLGQLVTLLARAGLVLSTDSGPAQIAAALERPVFVLWSGTSNPARWAPRGHTGFVRHPVPCEFCQLEVCPKPVHDCMVGLTPDAALRALEAFAQAAPGA